MLFLWAVLYVSARRHICTYCKKQVTFVTFYKVTNFYVRWHGSKYIEFHEKSLPMNLSQATSASLLPRRRGRKRSVSPIPLPHLFRRNVTWNYSLDHRSPKYPRPPPLSRPPWYFREYSGDIVPPPVKNSGMPLGEKYFLRQNFVEDKIYKIENYPKTRKIILASYFSLGHTGCWGESV